MRPIHAQPLVSKCRVEPTGRYWGSMNSRTTASSNGWVDQASLWSVPGLKVSGGTDGKWLGGAVSLMQEERLLGYGYLELTGYGAPLRI